LRSQRVLIPYLQSEKAVFRTNIIVFKLLVFLVNKVTQKNKGALKKAFTRAVPAIAHIPISLSW